MTYRMWRIVSLLLLIACWEILSLLIHNPHLLPGPDYVLCHSLPSIAQFGGAGEENYLGALKVIGKQVASTFLRLTCGILVGSLVGTGIGMSIHFYRRTHKANVLALAVARSIPLFALIPLFLYWFGGRELGTYLYVCFAVAVIVATNAYEAICNVPPAYAHQARLLGASRSQMFATVYAPAIGPEMIASLRTVLGLAWAFTLGAEYLSASSGLGFLVYQSYIYSDMGKLILLAFVYGLLGMVGYLLSNKLLFRLRRWQVGIAEESFA